MINRGLTIGILKPVHVISENKGQQLITSAIKNALLISLKTMPDYSNCFTWTYNITFSQKLSKRDENKTDTLEYLYVNNSISLMITTTAKFKQQKSMPGRKRCVLCKTISYLRTGTY